MSDSLERHNLAGWVRRPSIFVANAWYLLAAAGLYALPYILSALFAVLNIPGLDVGVFVSPAYNLLVLALPVLLYITEKPGIEQSLRLKRPYLMEGIEAVALAAPAVLLSDCISTWWYLLLQAIGGSLSPTVTVVPASGAEAAIYLVVLAVLPGICEELMFRGGILGAWERRGTLQAICVSSVLFCALHGSLQGLPVQLLLGFVLGLLVVRSDSLLTGMLFHVFYNAFSLLSGWIFGGADQAAYADLATWISEGEGYLSLVLRTFAGAFVFGAVLMMFFSHRKGTSMEKVKNPEREEMDWADLLVLIAALLTVAVRYGEDLMAVCGLY